MQDVKALRAFVASVFQLYPNYGGELLKDDNFKAQCRIHAPEIVKFQPDNYNDRLNKIKMLVAVPNFKDLLGNYKNSVMALAAAAGYMDKLNHDYHLAYPTQQKNDFSERHQKSIENQCDPELAKKHIEKIRNMFD